MAKTSSSELLELVRAGRKDYLKLFKLLEIKEFETKRKIKFELNSAQRVIHDVIEDQLNNERRCRLIILKSRRMGVSTYISARFFLHSVTRRNRHIVICCHTKRLTAEMFRWVKDLKSSYPNELLPESLKSNAQELVWNNSEGTGLNTQYSLTTAGSADKRGEDPDYLHESEVASHPWTGEFALGMESSIPARGRSEIIRESTAQGIGNFFYNQWMQAERGESSYIALFLPWWLMEAYRVKFGSSKEREEFRKKLGDSRYGGKEEIGLLGQEWVHELSDGRKIRAVCSLENLRWRREAIEDICQGELDKFHQEFPGSAREAFVTSGMMLFDKEILGRVFLRLEGRNAPKSEKYDIITGMMAKVQTRYGDSPWSAGWENERDYSSKQREKNERGDLEVWSPPVAGGQYVIGCDVAQGYEIAHEVHDAHCFYVMDIKDLRMCAVYRSRADTDQLAWILAHVGKWYNDCPIACEVPGPGDHVNRVLVREHEYPNIFYRTVQGEVSERATKKYGWSTNTVTRPNMLGEMKSMIRDHWELSNHTIRDKRLIGECFTFVNSGSGKYEAQGGCHDDAVMAYAITLQLAKLNPYEAPESAWSMYPSREVDRIETVNEW